ncbi:MAG: hypothetical protein ABSC17_07815 [Thermacetogeniaceae bacterium]
MDITMPVITLFIQGIPEAISLYALFFVLLGMKLEWRKIVPLGAGLAAAAYLLRLLPLVPGESMIILIFLNAAAFSCLTRQHSYTRVLFTVVAGTAILALLEALSGTISFQLLHTNAVVAKQHPLLWSLLGLPQVVALFIITLGIYRYQHLYKAKLASDGVLTPPDA